jgi:hypothetical protein
MSAIGAVSSVMIQAAMTKAPPGPPPGPPPGVKGDSDGDNDASGAASTGKLVNISA